MSSARISARRACRLLLPLLAALALLVGFSRLLAGPVVAARPAPLATPLAELPPTARVRVLLRLAPAADLRAVARIGDPVARRAALVATLRATAADAQRALHADLLALAASGHVTRVQPLWIVNAIALETTAARLPALAIHPAVWRIDADSALTLSLPITPAGRAPTATVDARAWGVVRSGAPHVWHGLGITGTGVTLAIVDTGVMWEHPDLRAGYRGLRADGSVQHVGHWFDATTAASPMPVDPLGHGTHVAGTAVGRNGIGVAPGAAWIGARIFDADGVAYTAGILRAYEWLLAPAGDPMLAPAIVNNSWGNPAPLTDFVDALAVLRLAGILTVFSTGNSGPFRGSIGVPAAYSQTLAVGASDFDDRTAWFSSRGPSLLTTQSKPTLVAPGVRVVSALANGQRAEATGTSMAAPHVAGSAALLLAADRALTPAALTAILTATAQPISATHPNSVDGWGRLDALAAVQRVLATPPLTLTLQGGSIPPAGAAVTLTTPAGARLAYTSDAAGRVVAYLRPGAYVVATQPFAYAPYTTALHVGAAPAAATLALTALPTAPLDGRVFDVAGHPLRATVRVVGAPLQTQADARGRYRLDLPPGQYTLHIHAPGYALVTAQVNVPPAGAIYSARLTVAQRVLLVDNAAWQYASQSAYYRQALNALGIAPDEWATRNPLFGSAGSAPTTADLLPYNLVIWADPYGSPGQVGAGRVISEYLDAGGRLLISGQNVGPLDGDGSPRLQQWWYYHLRGRLLGSTPADAAMVRGARDEFAALALQFNGADSADNQTQITQATLQPNSLSDELLLFDDGRAAALGAGLCRPYQLLYFGFGLEGVRGAGQRRALLAAGLAYLNRPPNPAGLRFRELPGEALVVPGTRLTQTVRLTNVSETMSETLRLSVDGAWPTKLISQTVTLGPCRSATLTLTVDVPADAARGTLFTTTVSATAASGHASATAVLTQRVPGYVLFVDDDRWYNNEAIYLDTLRRLGVTHDVWTTGWNTGVFADGRGSPPRALLDLYDIVLWYTGADWFAPITREESAALHGYMQQGGRLFLSSQDYLAYHWRDPLTRDYLGVRAHAEPVTPTQAFGDPEGAAPADWGAPGALTFRSYGNSADGILPAAGSRVTAWQNSGWPGGVASAGDGWRSVFWSMPLEALPVASAADAFGQAVGWLSDLGDSQLAVDRAVSAAGATRSFTLTLVNLPQAPPNRAAVTLTLPAGLTLDEATLDGGVRYLAAARQIVWDGTLVAGGVHTIRYRARVDATAGELETVAALWYARHNLHLTRSARVQVAAPDLHASTLAASGTRVGSPVVYTLWLHNDGAAGAVTVRLFVPAGFTLLGETVEAPAGALAVDRRSVTWRGTLRAAQQTKLQVAALAPAAPRGRWAPAIALLDNGGSRPLVRAVQPLLWPPAQQFLPLLMQPPTAER